jgi:hypothetical protein
MEKESKNISMGTNIAVSIYKVSPTERENMCGKTETITKVSLRTV